MTAPAEADVRKAREIVNNVLSCRIEVHEAIATALAAARAEVSVAQAARIAALEALLDATAKRLERYPDEVAAALKEPQP